MVQLAILIANVANFEPDWLEKLPLSASSKNRLAQLSVGHRRTQFLLGRWLMAQAANVTITDIVEGRDYPGFALRPDWQASISHSGPYVAVMASQGFRCGLDIEYSTRVRDWVALAERAFSRDEACWIASAKPAEQQERFQRIWTLREAAFKAGLWPSVVSKDSVFDPGSEQAPAGLHWQYVQQQEICCSVVAPIPLQVTLQPIHLPGS